MGDNKENHSALKNVCAKGVSVKKDNSPDSGKAEIMTAKEFQKFFHDSLNKYTESRRKAEEEEEKQKKRKKLKLLSFDDLANMFQDSLANKKKKKLLVHQVEKSVGRKKRMAEKQCRAGAIGKQENIPKKRGRPRKSDTVSGPNGSQV